MATTANETKFEELIERELLKQGFLKGDKKNFDKKFAIDTKLFWEFLETTQKEELAKLKRDCNYKNKILYQLDKMIKKYGILEILKNGLRIDDAKFTLFYELPLETSAEKVKKNFKLNKFSITRQISFSQSNPRLEIDMVIFINGLPIITIELKYPQKGQTAKFDAIKQYKETRNPKETLLNFARCIVHFAMDTDEVYMTTKLEGKKTFFLPFNKGNNFGAGNPVNPNGYKTAYMWEEILTKNSLADIIQHFVRLDGDKTKRLNSKTLYFPRYHQLDVVRKIIKDVKENGVGKRYLIQHSAGSGKSNSITWSAYQLIEVSKKEKKEPLFNSVIVVTDRKILDKQLRENIKNFSKIGTIIAPANSSKELKESLENGKKIIITTIQKFPFIVDGIADLSEKNFAVIIDEAHSSQNGIAHTKMNETIGKKTENDENEIEDIEELIIKSIENKRLQQNTSYFAFTATPKNSTLEKFGTKQADGTFKPFHLYSMKQAIEEGFILDVLRNYTTYKSYYQIIKSIEDNPLFETKKAQKLLKKFVEEHPKTIEVKAKIVLDHFLNNIVKTKKLKGKAKGMVVTSNIKSAILYYQALKKELQNLDNPFKIVIAFSGKKEINGIEYSEESLNNFPSKDIKEKFDEDEYRLLVVANKFLTGFDQPKLCAMYVDKKLQGVLAVQTLSRLNRSAPKYGKKTEDLFILDFYNDTEEIKQAFEPFYTSTTLREETDINVLHELKTILDNSKIYENDEVEKFFINYFKGVEADKLSPIIDKVAERFNNNQLELEEKQKADYKIKAKQFVKIYGQMVSIIPFVNEEWEKLFWFLKFLIPKMIIKDKNKELIDELLNSVNLSTYGLERVKLNENIELTDNEGKLKPQNSNPRGAYETEEKKNELDEIIKNFNEKYFNVWEGTAEEKEIIFFEIVKKVTKHPNYESKYLKNSDKYTKKIAFKNILNEVMENIAMEEDRNKINLFKLFIEDDNFKTDLIHNLEMAINTGKFTNL